MKLRRLELDHFKKFECAVCIDGIADGLNLVAGPNELGKSTLLEALRAVLFEKHRSAGQSVRDLQHHRHRTAPSVALDFELDGRAYRVEKRFLQRPFARLRLPDGQRLEGDPAEDRLQELLGRTQPMRAGGEVGGLWQVLLVGQGGSLEQAQVAGPARQTLATSLQAELGSLSGAESAHVLCQKIEQQLYELVDRRNGRPKGRYRQLEDALGAAVRELADLDRRRLDLEQDLERLERARALRRELRALAASDAGRPELAAASQRRDELMPLHAEMREAEAALELARRDVQAAEVEVVQREQLAHDLARAERARADAGVVCADARGRVEAAERQLAAARAELARMEALRADSEQRARVLEEVGRTLREHEQISAALDDVAAEVIVEILPDALERVRISGEHPAGSRLEMRITDPLEIEIAGVGRIGVRPAPDRRDRLLRRGEDCAKRLAGLRERLHAHAQAHSPVLDAPAVDEALREAQTSAERASSGGQSARAEAETALAAWHSATAAAEQATARLGELQAQEAGLRRVQALAHDAADGAALAAALHRAREQLGAVAARLEGLRALAGGESLDAVQRRIGELRGIVEERSARLQELEVDIGRLAARVELQQGAGLGEQVEAVRGRIEQLEQQVEVCRREAAILTLLRDVLRTAEQDMKDHYLAPVIARVRPYLQLLFPGAELAIDENFRVVAMTREAAGAERFELLSHGTREQLAVLTRLAFAELLADQGLPAVVVLDDALVFSDDDRLERMFQVLERAALRVQILVLTCRERAFAGLRAARPRLVDLGGASLDAAPMLSA